jgi:hypothetical protein
VALEAERDVSDGRAPRKVHRYVVTETWGDVPPDVLELVGEPDAYALDTYRGKYTQWELMRGGEIVGGWAGTHAGKSPAAAIATNTNATVGRYEREEPQT